MREVEDFEGEAEFIDPISRSPGYEQTESRIAILGHPIHAMSVAFPIALTFCVLGADVFYWWTGDARTTAGSFSTTLDLASGTTYRFQALVQGSDGRWKVGQERTFTAP